MNKARLKTYAPQARRDFIAAVEARAHLLGLSGKGGTLDIAPGERKGDIAVIAGQAWPAKVHEQRERLIRRMQKDGFAQTVEAVCAKPSFCIRLIRRSRCSCTFAGHA